MNSPHKLPRSVVLLSAGLDSTVNLFEAREKSEVILALTFDYGQRAAPRERARAAEIAKLVSVPHLVVELPWFQQFTSTSLVDRAQEVPTKAAVSIDDQRVSQQTAKAVWVPNRNGIFLNIGAGFAEGRGAAWVIPGFNREEAQTFPDNSEGFLRALDGSFHFSTATQVKAICFTADLDKTAIVARGRELGVPFSLMWPCYFDGAQTAGRPCGRCESCQRFARALDANGM